MALAKLLGVKSNLIMNDYGQDFFFFSFFSLHDAKKKLWGPFRKKSFLFAYQNFQKKKEEKATKREKKSFIHFFFKRKKFRF